MKKLFLALMLVSFAANATTTTTDTATQTAINQKLSTILTRSAHLSPKDAKYFLDNATHVLTYDTAAHLLAATPDEGTIGYALDTNAIYFMAGTSWTSMAGTAGLPEVYTTQVGMLAATPSDGTIGFAQDTYAFAFRGNGQWYPLFTQNILTFANGGTVHNTTNNAICQTENSEDWCVTFGTDTATFASTTGAIPTITPALTLTGDLTLNGGAGALRFPAASSSILMSSSADNSATGLIIGATGTTNIITIDTTDNVEGVAIAGYETVSSTLGVTGATTLTGVAYVNGGIDRSTAAGLNIGATNANAVTIKPATTITGDLTLNGGAGALTFPAASSSIVMTSSADNAAAGLIIGSTGATNIITVDTRDAAEGVAVAGYESVSGALYANGGIDRSSAATLAIGGANANLVTITPATTVAGTLTTNGATVANGIATTTPAVYEVFNRGAGKGLTIMTATGTASPGASGTLNKAYTLSGHVFNFTPIGTETLVPAMTATGLDIAGDQDDDEGYEIWGGVLGASGRPFVVGTDAAFKFCASVKVADGSGTDDFHIGFRKAEPYQAAFDDYNDAAAIGIVGHNNPGAIKIETITGGGATTTTDTTDTWTDGATKIMCVLVSEAGAVTYTNAGQAPSQTAAFSFADGTLVVPFIRFLQYSTDFMDTLEITSWQVAFQ